ncbi:MAG TPA: DUF2147 domain-containing protein [Nevskiaceae bacterium]
MFVCVPQAVHAAVTAPVGQWIQTDPEAKIPESSLVRIDQMPDGTLQGVVTRVLQSRLGTDPRCGKCTGELHDKPFVGMTVLWGLRRDGDKWDQGWVLDPRNGKTYKVEVTPIHHGEALDVRAYVGTPLFGRTQVWKRYAAGGISPHGTNADLSHNR